MRRTFWTWAAGGDIPNGSVTWYRSLGDDDGNDQLPHVLDLVNFPAREIRHKIPSVTRDP